MATIRNAKLAIEGGTPVRSTPMPPRSAIGPAERAMIDEALAYFADRKVDPGYQGPFEARYCEAFAGMMGGGYADAVATGTASIFVALAALGLPAGSEVLVSPITDPGSVSAIIMLGLVPRLIDSMPDSYNVGPEQVQARISAKTAAIVLVHSIGRAADAEAIMALCHAHNIKVLEDCSQSHGAMWKGQRIGRYGDIAAFSTMYRKASITGASGGIVYTLDEELFHQALAHADRGKQSWRPGFDDRDPSQFLFPALNLHTDELSCAIGVASLSRLDETRRRRLAYVAGVTAQLPAASKICRPYGYSEDDSPFIYPIIVDPQRISVSKEEFAKAVLAEGIGLSPHYRYLVVDWPWVKPYLSDQYETPNARSIRDRTFNLYLNENYGEQEVIDTVAAIAKVEAVLGQS